MRCNGLLEAVSKAAIIQRLPAESANRFDKFHQCTICGQPYWKGSHYDQMQELINTIRETD